MPILQARLETSLPSREKQSVALTSLGWAALLTALKVLVGLLTGSLGILSEAAHSGLDLVAAAVTYGSVRLADRPADSSHPFGHGKFEHLSAFIQTALLLVTCGLIILAAVRRLFFHAVRVDPSGWPFGVLLSSMTFDVFRSRPVSPVAGKSKRQ